MRMDESGTALAEADYGAVTWEYKAKDADDSAYSTDVPANAGDYTVRASIAESDLYAAAHRADIVFDGYVCRPIIGADRVALNVTVSDTYDFEWWGLSDARRNNSLPAGILIMVGNNLAYLDQCVGYIRPFRWEAHFKDSGRYTR